MTLIRNVLINGRWYGPAYPGHGEPPAGRAQHRAARDDVSASAPAAPPTPAPATAPGRQGEPDSGIVTTEPNPGPVTTADTGHPADAATSTPEVPGSVGPDGQPATTSPAPAQPVPSTPEVPAPPPRSGKGSTNTAWRSWADRAGLDGHDASSRDEIIADAVERGMIEPE